jgi:predicted permease
MDDKPQRKPRFWPVVFLVAFLLGAVLWGLWMSRIIQQTRASRTDPFFVPVSTNTNSLPAPPPAVSH